MRPNASQLQKHLCRRPLCGSLVWLHRVFHCLRISHLCTVNKLQACTAGAGKAGVRRSVLTFVLPSLCPPYIPQRLHGAQRRFVTSDGLLALGILGGHKAALLREWSPLSAQPGLALAEDSSGGKWGAGPAPGVAPGQEDRQPGRDRPLATSGPWTYFVLV